ncbi:hypothetical protein ACLB2K_077551 [Fragaria x ananassa]
MSAQIAVCKPCDRVCGRSEAIDEGLSHRVAILEERYKEYKEYKAQTSEKLGTILSVLEKMNVEKEASEENVEKQSDEIIDFTDPFQNVEKEASCLNVDKQRDEEIIDFTHPCQNVEKEASCLNVEKQRDEEIIELTNPCQNVEKDASCKKVEKQKIMVYRFTKRNLPVL